MGDTISPTNWGALFQIYDDLLKIWGAFLFLVTVFFKFCGPNVFVGGSDSLTRRSILWFDNGSLKCLFWLAVKRALLSSASVIAEAYYQTSKQYMGLYVLFAIDKSIDVGFYFSQIGLKQWRQFRKNLGGGANL